MMKATLNVNGVETSYPAETAELEKLLLYVMEKEISEEEQIVHVSLDGKMYSEPYEHQAREVSLEMVKRVDLTTQTQTLLALEFLKSAPTFLEHIENGFAASARLLKGTPKEGKGYDLLARSLEALRSLMVHLDNVQGVLAKGTQGKVIEDLSSGLNRVADGMIASQEKKDPAHTAHFIEYEILPLLKERREAFYS